MYKTNKQTVNYFALATKTGVFARLRVDLLRPSMAETIEQEQVERIQERGRVGKSEEE